MKKVDKEAIKHLGEGLLQFIASALIIKPLNDSPDDVISSGTFSYVDTGQETLLVTCDHVYAEFERLRAADNGIGFCWGPGAGQTPISLTATAPLDREAKIDLCTYECTVDGGLAQISKAFVKPKAWPPQRVSRGDLVIGIGFPGAFRSTETRNGQKGLSLVASLVSGQVHSVADRHFTLAD